MLLVVEMMLCMLEAVEVIICDRLWTVGFLPNGSDSHPSVPGSPTLATTQKISFRKAF